MDDTVKRDAFVFPTVAALSQAMCMQFLQRSQAAIAERGRFTVALSGGRTPREMYHQLGSRFKEWIPWKQVHLFWGDERYVPHDDPHSNYRMVREAMLENLPIPQENIHPMPTHFPDPEEAARAYEATLRAFFGEGLPRFDMLLLGVGTDGHTASLFPGTPALQERERLVVPVTAPTEPPIRLSLTFPVLLNARQAFFMVAGADKREVVRAIFADPAGAARRYPAATVHRETPVVWFLDEEASPGRI